MTVIDRDRFRDEYPIDFQDRGRILQLTFEGL
jgi:hypothetical protein